MLVTAQRSPHRSRGTSYGSRLPERERNRPLELEHVFNGRYRVDARLGNGGMAIVYCGTDLLLRRRVAIKVLRDQFSADDDFIQRFSAGPAAAMK